MKKLISLFFISLLLVSACKRTKEEVVTEPAVEPTTEVVVPTIEPLPDGWLSYSSQLLRFNYPETYEIIEPRSIAPDIIVEGENGDLTFVRSEFYENADEIMGEDITVGEGATEHLRVGRQVYGYEVFLTYSDDETKAELHEIFDSIEVLQSYRNNAHAFTVVFPQDWYFNFERNDVNCLSPYEFGAINTSEDCSEALINIYVPDSDAEEVTSDQILENSKEVDIIGDTIDKKIGDYDVKTSMYVSDETPMIIYAFEFNGKWLLIDLSDATYQEEAEKIIASLQ